MGRPARTQTPTPIDDNADTEKLERAMQHLSEDGARLASINRRFGDNLPYSRDRVLSEIRFYMNASAEAMLETGMRLVLLKENEPRGDFHQALEQLGIRPRGAQKLMQAAVKYGEGPRAKLATLGRSKLLELLTEDDEELDALAEGETLFGHTLDDIDCMSVSELRGSLRKARAEREDREEIHERMLADKDSAINRLDAQIKRRETGERDERALAIINDELDPLVAQISVQLDQFSAAYQAFLDLYGDEELRAPANLRDKSRQAVDRLYRRLSDLEFLFGPMTVSRRPDHTWVADAQAALDAESQSTDD